MNKTDELRNIWDAVQQLDNGLFRLHSLCEILHTACSGQDELQPEVIQSYIGIMDQQLSFMSQDILGANLALKELLKDQEDDPAADQDPEDDQAGAPLLYTDQEGKQHIFWDQET